MDWSRTERPGRDAESRAAPALPRISAIAAYGNPTRLYGLGNGQLQDGGIDAPNLYSIDLETGAANLVGALGSQAGGYTQGGLAFDEDGGLWAVTDRSIVDGSP